MKRILCFLLLMEIGFAEKGTHNLYRDSYSESLIGAYIPYSEGKPFVATLRECREKAVIEDVNGYSYLPHPHVGITLTFKTSLDRPGRCLFLTENLTNWSYQHDREKWAYKLHFGNNYECEACRQNSNPKLSAIVSKLNARNQMIHNTTDVSSAGTFCVGSTQLPAECESVPFTFGRTGKQFSFFNKTEPVPNNQLYCAMVPLACEADKNLYEIDLGTQGELPEQSVNTASPTLPTTSSTAARTNSSMTTTTSSTAPTTSTSTTTTITSSPTTVITTSTTASTAKTSTISTKPLTPLFTTTTTTLSTMSTTRKTPTTVTTATTTTSRTTASTSSSIATTVTTTSTIPSDTPTTSMTTIPKTASTTSITEAPNTVTNTSTTTSSKTSTATSSSVTTQKTVPTTPSRTTPSAKTRNTLPASSTTQSTETTKITTSSTTKVSTALSKITSPSTITSYSTKTRTAPATTSEAIATTSTSSQQTPRSARMTTLLATTTTATTRSTMSTSKPTIEATSSKTTASTETDHMTTEAVQTSKTLGEVSSVRSSASTSTTPVTTTSPIKIHVTSAPAISTGSSKTNARSSAVSVTTESFTTNPTTSTPAAELGSPSSSAQTTTVTASTASAKSASTEKLTRGTFGADSTVVVTESTSSMTTVYETVTGGTEAQHVPTSGSDATISTSSEHSTTVHHTQLIAITKTAEAADETTVKSDQENNVIESTTAQLGTSADDQRTHSSAPPPPSSGISSESDAPTTSSTSSTTTTKVNKQQETTTKTLSSTLGLRTTRYASSVESTVMENVENIENTERTTTTETEPSNVQKTTETDSTTVPTTPAEVTTTVSVSMISDVKTTDPKTTDPSSTSTIIDEVPTTMIDEERSSVSSAVIEHTPTTIQNGQTTEQAAFSTYDANEDKEEEATVTVSSASIDDKTTRVATKAGSEETDRLTSTGIRTNGPDSTATTTVSSASNVDGSSTGAKTSTTTTQAKEATEIGKVSTEKKTVTSTERAHCQDVCPPGFNESHSFCYHLAPQEKSLTYAAAISYCQSLSSPQSNLATAFDFQDEQTRQLIQELRMEDDRPIDAFVVNAQGSASFRNLRQIDLLSLSLVTRFHVNPFLSVEVGSELEGVNAICRAPKFCRPNTCPLELFYEHSKQLVVGLPPERSELLEGEELIAPCIQFRTGQEHRIRCLQNGQFSVHPSLVTCRKPEDVKEEEIDTPLNPLYPKTCQDCYEIGTEKCTKNRNGPGVLCQCKAGWTQRTCWMSPVLCNERSCGEHGQCVSYVDYTECMCEKGWIGDRCTVNASRATWLGSNDSLAVFDLRSAGLATQSVTSMMILLLKFVSKVFTEQDCIDPQDTFQDFRRVTMCVAGFLGIFFTHPDIFGLDPIGCRFHYVMISVCYTFGLVFWAGEGLNIMYVCRGINKNVWSVDFDGNQRKFLRYAYRVTLPALLSMMMVIGIIGHSWTLVGNSFNCFGSFAQANGKTWSPLLALNCCWLLVAYAGCEGAGLLLRNRPHCYIRLIHWFNLYQPRNLEQVNKVHRNRNFVSVGATLHLLSWIVLSIASDTNTSVMDTTSFLLSILYSGWCFLQFLITDESAYGKFSMIMMCILPKKLSPTFDWRFLRNRDETLAANFNWRYKREQNALIREEDKRIEKERLEIEEKNKRLREKFPNIPSRLLYHCPLEGPAVSHPRSFPFDPSRDEFMTAYERECLVKIWTQSYLDTRAFLKRTPEQCAFEVVKKELQRHCMQQKTTDRKQQELYLLGQWWMSVPGRDSVKLRAHEKGVVMVDPDETPLLAFERAVSKLASIIDLRENRKRKRLLVDEEIIPFSNASKFIRFLPSVRIQVCKCRVLDQWGDPEEKKFIKMPDIVLQEQIEMMEKVCRKTIDEDNISFNKVYTDDIVYSQWIGSEYESAAKEILGVVPAQIGEQPISMNPRRRPLDQHWLDTAKPDFIGPRQERDAIPLGPYGHYARSCVYFQAQLDAQWEKYRRNAAIVRAEEKIRKGEL